MSSTAEETTLFQQGSIVVTNARFISGQETYAIRNVTSVSSTRQPPKRGALVITALAGLLLCTGAPFVGAPLASGALFLLWKARPTYHVVLRTAGGEANALESTDQALIQRVVDALNQAMVVRG